MATDVKYFFVLSFVVRNQAGIAISLADTERTAFTALTRGGRYNATPDDYELVSSQNVGCYNGSAFGLVLESYTNALVAYDAISKILQLLPDTKAEKERKEAELKREAAEADRQCAESQRAGVISAIQQAIVDIIASTYTKSEIDEKLSNLAGFVVVSELPSVGDSKKIYLLGPIGTGTDQYEEYIYSEGSWVKIGDTSIDLSEYAKVDDVPAIFVAEFGVTTNQELFDAYVQGKSLIVQIDDTDYQYLAIAQDYSYGHELCSTDDIKSGQGSTNIKFIAALDDGRHYECRFVANYDTADDTYTEEWIDKQTVDDNNVFWATYGSTTSAEIYTAYNAGKIVLCYYNGCVHYLESADSGSNVTFVGIHYQALYEIYVNNNTWNRQSFGQLAYYTQVTNKEDKANKVTSISASSTHTQYASAKAVYDALQNSGKGIYYCDTNSSPSDISDAIAQGKLPVFVEEASGDENNYYYLCGRYVNSFIFIGGYGLNSGTSDYFGQWVMSEISEQPYYQWNYKRLHYDVFKVEYNITSHSDVEYSNDHGKICYCDYNNGSGIIKCYLVSAPLTSGTTDPFVFCGFDSNTKRVYVLTLESDDSWDDNSFNIVSGSGINNIVSLTQAEYDALTTKDANTLYVIK